MCVGGGGGGGVDFSTYLMGNALLISCRSLTTLIVILTGDLTRVIEVRV